MDTLDAFKIQKTIKNNYLTKFLFLNKIIF